jgi:cell division protein FtsN
MSKKFWIVVSLVLIPALSMAQSSADSVAYRKAQSMVNDGNATAGRALVDSMIAKAAPGTPAYAEGLYWRAVLSATAADAEMDYRRIIVDYPLSSRVEDVLLRLAQLEMARADYDAALQHLNRLTIEHPMGATRARAGYWMARVLFEKNDIPRACAANADALARTSQDDTELRNQISYLNQRCAGVVIAQTSPTVVDTTTKVVSVPATLTPAPVPPPAPAPVSPPPVPPTQSANTSQKPLPKLPSKPRDMSPSIIRDDLPNPKPSATASSGDSWSVQIAAYDKQSEADAMVARLKKRGYEARVSGTSAPFRVRIGHYPTQAQAGAVMRSLKAKQINGFVVKAETE